MPSRVVPREIPRPQAGSLLLLQITIYAQQCEGFFQTITRFIVLASTPVDQR